MYAIRSYYAFPYAAVLLAIGAGVYRYFSDRFSYTSHSTQFLRITSYNVCYTKLLRLGAESASAATAAKPAPSSGEAPAPETGDPEIGRTLFSGT